MLSVLQGVSRARIQLSLGLFGLDKEHASSIRPEAGLEAQKNLSEKLIGIGAEVLMRVSPLNCKFRIRCQSKSYVTLKMQELCLWVK